LWFKFSLFEGLPMNPTTLIEPLVELGERVRDDVRKALASRPMQDRSKIHGQAASDVIYQIDLDAEEAIRNFLKDKAGALGGIVLIAEGMNEDKVNVFPEGTPESKAAWRLIIDPIDGTREIMVGKRSAFFLAGAAPNQGPGTRLAAIEAAAMVEIPTDRALWGDALWAVKGGGTQGFTRNLLNGTKQDWNPAPTQEPTIRGGFGQIVRFVHPGKDILSIMEEEMVKELFPSLKDREIALFDDQYLSTGGQIYELLTGKDRFTADLRQSLYAKLGREGKRTGHVCHPYDLAAYLVGTEAGVILTSADGKPLDGPMDTVTGMDWIGYANARIRDEVAPLLTRLVKKYLS
jgi:fructose-1,6-bisphosphatase/inositol monophosphatase family enzyme